MVEGLDEEDREAWAEDKAALQAGLADRFARRASSEQLAVAPLQEAAVTLVPMVRRVQTGVFVGASRQPSKVVIEVEAGTVRGDTLMRLRLQHGTPASMRFRSLAHRLRNDGEAIAEALVRYLVSWRDSASSEAMSARLSTLPRAFLGSASRTARRRGTL